MVSAPTADRVLEASQYAKPNQPVAPHPFSPGGRRACFAIDDQSASHIDHDRPIRLEPVTTVCVNLVAATEEIGWAGYEAKGDHARSVGHWSEAEDAYGTAIGLLDRATVHNANQGMASLLNKWGAVLSRRHDMAGAEKAHRRALTIYTSIRGSEDLRVADTLDLLAVVLQEQQPNQALAGPLFFRAWAIREKVLGPEHPAVADSLHHLALSLYSDNLSMAIQLLLRSMEIRKKVFGQEHPSVADSLNAMALQYEAHQRRDLAIPLYQEVLTIREKVFGPNASETLQARSNLDMAHRWMDHPDQDPSR